MINILTLTSSSISIELVNNDCYFTSKYEVFLNEDKIGESSKNIFSYYDLKPNTSYLLEIKQNQKFERIQFITKDYVFKEVRSSDLIDKTDFLQNELNNLKDNEVLVLKGTFKVISLAVRNNNKIYLPKGSKLIGEIDRYKYPIFSKYEELNGKPLGSWEGEKRDVFCSILNFLGVSNCLVYGQGIIDYQAQYSDFWLDHHTIKKAYRPNGIFIHTSNNISFQGITCQNTPSWNQHPFYSTNIDYIDCKFINPKDSPTTDGIDPESCSNIKIIGTYISVGDDCIAIKSGKIDFARKYKTPCRNIIIRNCLMENGHGGVTLGSENSGGINNVRVENCYFKKTDRGLRIKSQRGRGNLAVISDIVFNNIYMDNVKSALVINAFYKAGSDQIDYRFDRHYLEKNDDTPEFDKFVFSNMVCKNLEYGLGYFLGLPESKIKEIVLKNISVSYLKNASSGSMAMTKENEKFRKIGIFAENVDRLILENVNFLNKPSEKLIVKDVIVEEK